LPLSSTSGQTGYNARYVIIISVVITFFTILFGRLWYMQIVKRDYYKNLSENNRIRVRTIKAIRGMIFDINGETLIDNYPYFNLAVIPENVKDTEALLDTLSEVIEIDKAALKEKIHKERFKPAFKPVILLEDLKREQLSKVEARKLDLPGIEIMIESIRNYPYKDMASHIIGYLSEIDSRKLKLAEYENYSQGDLVGNVGVEKTYEKMLKGKDGLREVEVDAFGRELSSRIRKEAQPGSMLYLTINAKLQRFVEETFTEKAGSVVVMDANTGQIYAQFSNPNFAPSLFIKGISLKNWDALNEDPLHPMQNKVIAGQYSPGSVFKIAVAAAALEEGYVTKETTFTCNGSYRFGRSRFSCWKRWGHGKVNVVDAIAESCDVYFYNLGALLGINLIAEYAHKFGLGEPTGIDLEFEKRGLIPTTQWKKRALNDVWFGGETISAAIGQSYVLVTPLQVTVMTAAVANGEFIPVPQLMQKTESIDGTTLRRHITQIKTRLDLSEETIELLREGLFDVLNSKKGTARGSKPRTVTAAGKTGTVQVYSEKIAKLQEKAEKENGEKKELPYELRDHAWFTCYAPYEKPEIVVTVLVEHGGHGASAAAPVAKKIIDFYFTTIKGAGEDV
jgi:penicillin-binding protein 2